MKQILIQPSVFYVRGSAKKWITFLAKAVIWNILSCHSNSWVDAA